MPTSASLPRTPRVPAPPRPRAGGPPPPLQSVPHPPASGRPPRGGGGYWGLSLSPSVRLLPPGAGALGAPSRTVHSGRDTQALWVGFPAPREVSSQGWGAHWGRSPCGRPSSGPRAETWTVSPSCAGTKDAASRRRRPWGGYLGGRGDRARAVPPQPPAGSRRAEGVSSQLLKPAWGWGWSGPPSSSPSQAAGPLPGFLRI